MYFFAHLVALPTERLQSTLPELHWITKVCFLWAAACLLPQREALALHCLKLGGFTTYLPRIRKRRIVRGRKVTVTPPLFPGYAFVAIELQWHAARWAPGVAGLIMDGTSPARVPDQVIDEIRRRERRGLIDLPSWLKLGDRVQIEHGPFRGLDGLYDGQAPQERVFILLTLLGTCGAGRRHRPLEVTLPVGDIEDVVPVSDIRRT